MTITAEQVRAARALLNWSQGHLSGEAGVARATIAEFEGGRRIPISNNLAAIRTALETAGVQFLADGDVAVGSGVALANKT